MSAIELPYDENNSQAGHTAAAMSGVRARGLIRISSECRDGISVRDVVREEGSLRVRFPREHGPGLSAVLVNTGGGMTGGDQFSISATSGAGSVLTLTSTAAEKFYRSLGDTSQLSVNLEAKARSSLAWLPQESILFDGARVQRRYDVVIDSSATALLCDMTCIGRQAMGESVSDLSLRDRWNIRIGGQLCLADYTLIDGHAAKILARESVAGGATSFGTIIYAGTNAKAACDAVRTILFATDGIDGAAGMVNGICLARVLARDLVDLRNCVAACSQILYDAPVPRSWRT